MFLQNIEYLLSLLDLHFPKNHIYNSLFIRNKVKISCSCIQNLKSIKNNHNTAEIEESYKDRRIFLDEKCLAPNIIYEAQFMLNQPKENIYIGTAKTNFKHRFNNHTKSFKLEHYKNDTELPKEYWMIKRNHFISKINWKIISKWAPFNTTKSYKSLHKKEVICWTKGRTYWLVQIQKQVYFYGMIVNTKSYVFTEIFFAVFRLRLPIWPAPLIS